VEDVATTRFMRAAHGRPARLVWSFIALALMGPACAERANNSDTENPVIVTGSGAEITHLERDETRRTVAATVAEHGIERHLTLAPLPDGPSPGLVATLDDGESFYELSIAVNEHTGELWIRERTAVDEMAMTFREAHGRVFESYDINGERLSFDYPALEAEQLDKAVARYRAGDIDMAATPELREVGVTLAAFDAFYTPTTANTLHDNPAGSLLVSLLSDPIAASAITGGDVTPQRVDGAAQRVCWAASLCMRYKCKLGGLANPLCTACGGVTAACLFTEVACWIAGCDCCY
jgi:hypothetical protein